MCSTVDGKTFDNTLGRWAQVVSDAMLAPFGVNAAGSTVSAAGTSGGIDAIYTRSSPVPVYIAGTNSRYMRCTGLVVLLPAGVYAYQLSRPLYTVSHQAQPVMCY